MIFAITGLITLLCILTIVFWVHFGLAVENEESSQKIRIRLILAAVTSVFLVATIGQTAASCSSEQEVQKSVEAQCPKKKCPEQSSKKDTAFAADKNTDW